MSIGILDFPTRCADRPRQWVHQALDYPGKPPEGSLNFADAPSGRSKDGQAHVMGSALSLLVQPALFSGYAVRTAQPKGAPVHAVGHVATEAKLVGPWCGARGDRLLPRDDHERRLRSC